MLDFSDDVVACFSLDREKLLIFDVERGGVSSFLALPCEVVTRLVASSMHLINPRQGENRESAVGRDLNGCRFMIV